MSEDPAIEPGAEPAPAPAPVVVDPPELAVTPAPKADKDDPAPEPKAPDPAPEPKREPTPAWMEDWRKAAAEHIAAGDRKAFERELKRAGRFTDPTSVYAAFRELESKFDRGGLTKIPGADATEEEKTAFRKAMGYPEKPDEFISNLKLANNAVLGDMDKPVAERFAGALHKANSPQEAMNLLADQYLVIQEEQMAALDEQDDSHKTEFEAVLKDEFGPSTKRIKNAIESLFATAPGGLDANNPDSLYNRLFKGGRTADGRLILNDPDTFRWLASIAREVKPLSAVTEDGIESGKAVQAELDDIKKVMREDRRRYDKDEAMQARYRELVSAQQRDRARSAA